ALGVWGVGCSNTTGPGGDPLSGQWGGPHAGLIISSDSTRIEFDCAGGAVGQAIRLDQAGRFSVAGTYVRGGGPVNIDNPDLGQPARYEGPVRGPSMTPRGTVARDRSSSRPI